MPLLERRQALDTLLEGALEAPQRLHQPSLGLQGCGREKMDSSGDPALAGSGTESPDPHSGSSIIPQPDGDLGLRLSDLGQVTLLFQAASTHL